MKRFRETKTNEELRDKKRRCLIGGRKTVSSEECCEYSNGRGFDFDMLKKVNTEKLLDDLSDDEADYGVIAHRDDRLTYDDPNVNEKDRVLMKKTHGFHRKVPLKSRDRIDYSEFMLKNAWKPNDEDISKIKSDFSKVKSLRNKVADDHQNNNAKGKTSQPIAKESFGTSTENDSSYYYY